MAQRMARVSGLLYTPSFLTDDDEHTLLNLIDNQPWSAALKRRVQHYGYSYNYQARNTSLTQPLPDWLRQLGERVSAAVDGHPRFDQVIINEYTPGQGIAAHVDHRELFGPVVVTVSLGSDVVMDFANGGITVPVLLERRSMTCLTGPARYTWTHRIAARQSDMVAGQRRARFRRVSVTFRTIM